MLPVRYSPLWRMLDGTIKITSVLLLAFAGAILNRMRGSDGGMLFLQSYTGYWMDHALASAVLAWPTGALLNVLTHGDSLSSTLFTLLTWASLIVGWGTYKEAGASTTGYNNPIGIFDWWFGREMDDGWSFAHRWTRDVSAMSLHGLVWTAPAGYLLHHRGYGWQYALSGAAMGFMYSVGQKVKMPTPTTGGEFMFATGGAWCESMWGWWVWFSIISACVARPGPPGAVVPGVGCTRWFEGAMLVFSLFCVASCVYYATVVQCDHANWAKSIVGLVISTIALLAQQAYNIRGWRAHKHAQYLRVPTVDDSVINTDVNWRDTTGGENLYRLCWVAG